MQGRWLHRYVKIATGVTIYIYTSWNDSHTQVIVLSAHSFSDVVRSIETLDLFFVFFFIGGMGVLREHSLFITGGGITGGGIRKRNNLKT